MLKVCLVCIEFFGRGVYGGFGRATRVIGRELSKRNIEVTAVVPQRQGSPGRSYKLDGIHVREFPAKSPGRAIELFRQTGADVFHSQDPSLSSWLAMKALPDSAHVLTFRDTMTWKDWRIEFRHAGPARLGTLQYALYVDNFLTRRAVRKADGLYCAARFLIAKSARKYRLQQTPGFLPTPVEIPSLVVKACKPTVCMVGRLHRRKRPELFLKLAVAFPHVQFICVGGTNERAYEQELRQTYAHLPNLEMTGTIDQFRTDRLQRIFEKSWVLVSTSEREGLPNTFLEAAANRCAILSAVDPDGFASRFGYLARSSAELAIGLRHLLEEDRWKQSGEAGFQFVKPLFGAQTAVEYHLQAYQQALNRRSAVQTSSVRRGA